jgi:ferredoxin-NADP reductase
MSNPEPAAAGPDEVRVTLDRRELVAESTYAFHFGLGGAHLPYKPGQVVDLRFPGATRPDPRGHVRAFSLAAAPGAPRLTIATRIRQSPFKLDLLEAPLGTELFASKPWGDFIVPPDETDVVMIAGGIGVTPFRAILQEMIATSAPAEMSLLHSGRTPEETPFLDEFRRWSATNPQFAYLPTMTHAERSPHAWIGERRRIDAPFLSAVLDDGAHAALYMVAGPPAFVDAVADALVTIGVPAGRVMRDAFDGY